MLIGVRKGRAFGTVSVSSSLWEYPYMRIPYIRFMSFVDVYAVFETTGVVRELLRLVMLTKQARNDCSFIYGKTAEQQFETYMYDSAYDSSLILSQ